jgi:hypothetical protein
MDREEADSGIVLIASFMLGLSYTISRAIRMHTLPHDGKTVQAADPTATVEPQACHALHHHLSRLALMCRL